MLVKVSENFDGVFGYFDDRTVHAKRAGDPPFVVPDGVAATKIAEGVLEAVSRTKQESPDPPKRRRKR